MIRFRRKPLEIEAIQYTGDNHDEVTAFCVEHFGEPRPDLFEHLVSGFWLTNGPVMVYGFKLVDYEHVEGRRWRRKPIEIEAVEFDGNNRAEIKAMWERNAPDRPLSGDERDAYAAEGVEPPQTLYESWLDRLAPGMLASIEVGTSHIGLCREGSTFYREYEEARDA